MKNQELATRLLESGDSESVAIKFCGGKTTYREFNRSVELLARKIQSVAPTKDGSVLLLISKSEHGVIGIVGTLLAGLTYVPAPLDLNASELEKLIQRCGCQLILHDNSIEIEVLQPLLSNEFVVVNVEDFSNDLGKETIEMNSNKKAALLHTSGSTDAPKVVHISSLAISIFVDWAIDSFSIGANDAVLNNSPLTFDLTFLDVLGTLAAGATVLLTSVEQARNGFELNRLCRIENPTVWHSTPTSLRLLKHSFDGVPYTSVKTVLFAGEPMPVSLLNELHGIFPAAEFYNIYGCTETNDTFMHKCKLPFIGSEVPIGMPIPYVEWLILDDDGNSAVVGELLVSCPTMLEKYGSEHQTREAIKTIKSKLFYRTRDQVKVDSEGLFYMVGRTDGIVKVNGLQIQLTHVESVLQKMPGISEVVVFISSHSETEDLVAIAYAEGDISSIDLRRYASEFLSGHSMPKSIKISEQPLPKNSHGKICRRTVSTMFS